MLCDRIMDLSQFTLIAILSVFLVGVPEATSWESRELDRHDGYDLQRGPVFYEAFYPGDQGPAATDQQRSPINPQTARQYFDHASILEKTNQALEDAQNGDPHERSSRNGREQLFPGDYNAASIPTESFRITAQETRNPTDLRTGSDQAFEVARQLKRFVEGLGRDPNPRNDPNIRDFEDPRGGYGGAVAGRNFHTSNPYLQTDYETAFPNERSHSDRRLDDYMNIILSAIKKEALEISKGQMRDEASMPDDTEGNARISRQQRYVKSEDSFGRPRPEMRDFQENLNTIARSVKLGARLPEVGSEDWGRFFDKKKYSNHNDQFDSHNTSGDEYQDVRGPISQTGFHNMENIFQPRPQVISYVFSSTRTPTKALSSMGGPKSEPPESRSARLNDQPLGNYRNDDLIGNKMRNEVVKSDGLSIASIEVSEVPRHKIRHHHGEKPKLNQQHHTTAKVDE